MKPKGYEKYERECQYWDATVRAVESGLGISEAAYYVANIFADDDGEEETIAQRVIQMVRNYEDMEGRGSFVRNCRLGVCV